MAYDFRSGNKYLNDTAQGIVSQFPNAFGATTRLVSVSASNTERIFGGHGTSAASSSLFWYPTGAGGTDAFYGQVNKGGNNIFFASAAVSEAVETYYQLTFSCAASNDHRMFVDGGNKGTDTTTSTGATWAAETWIGAGDFDAGPSQYLDGDACECFAYDGDSLTDDEVASIGEGFIAPLVKLGGLTYYSPLVRETTEWMGQATLSATGSPTSTDHPRIFMWF